MSAVIGVDKFVWTVSRSQVCTWVYCFAIPYICTILTVLSEKILKYYLFPTGFLFETSNSCSTLYLTHFHSTTLTGVVQVVGILLLSRNVIIHKSLSFVVHLSEQAACCTNQIKYFLCVSCVFQVFMSQMQSARGRVVHPKSTRWEIERKWFGAWSCDRPDKYETLLWPDGKFFFLYVLWQIIYFSMFDLNT